MRIPHNKYMAILQLPTVRAAMRAKANKIAAKARNTAAQEGVDTQITVVFGVRPKGRPYARVQSSNGAAEHGTSWTKRSRVLGRTIAGKGPQ